MKKRDYGLITRKTSKNNLEDFYETPVWASKILYNHFDFTNYGNQAWEFCCGKGKMSNVMWNYFENVISTDAIDRGYKKNFSILDFMSTRKAKANILITNPPYVNANNIVSHALTKVKSFDVICLLLRQSFQESKSRYFLFEDYRPYKIVTISDRVDFSSENPGGMFSLAWYIWIMNDLYLKRKYSEMEWDCHPTTKKEGQMKLCLY